MEETLRAWGSCDASQSQPERDYAPATLAARGRAVGSAPLEKVWGGLEQTEGWRRLCLVICGKDRPSPGLEGPVPTHQP